MGILIEALAAKFGATEPALEVEAGIRQESQIDGFSNLSLEVEEMDAYIGERLIARENEALLVLSAGNFPFPCPPELLPLAIRNRNNDQRAALLANQIQTAASAVEEFVLGDLFFKASNRNNDQFMQKAFFYLGDKTLGRKGQAELTLDKVLMSVMAMGNDPAPSSTPSNRLGSALLSRGKYEESEYRRADGDWDNNPETVWGVDYRRYMSQ